MHETRANQQTSFITYVHCAQLTLLQSNWAEALLSPGMHEHNACHTGTSRACFVRLAWRVSWEALVQYPMHKVATAGSTTRLV